SAPPAGVMMAEIVPAKPAPAPAPRPVAARPAPMPVSPVIADGAGDSVIDLSTYRRRRKSLGVHLLPLLALAMVLAGLMLRDLIARPQGGPANEIADVDLTRRLSLQFDEGVGKDVSNTMRF